MLIIIIYDTNSKWYYVSSNMGEYHSSIISLRRLELVIKYINNIKKKFNYSIVFRYY